MIGIENIKQTTIRLTRNRKTPKGDKMHEINQERKLAYKITKQKERRAITATKKLLYIGPEIIRKVSEFFKKLYVKNNVDKESLKTYSGQSEFSDQCRQIIIIFLKKNP